MFKPLIDLIRGKNTVGARSTTEHTHLNFVTQVDRFDTNLDDFVTVHWTYYLRTTPTGIVDRKIHVKEVVFADRLLIANEGFEPVIEMFGQKALFPHNIMVNERSKTILIEFLTPISFK
jgi:hypothetical protein